MVRLNEDPWTRRQSVVVDPDVSVPIDSSSPPSRSSVAPASPSVTRTCVAVQGRPSPPAPLKRPRGAGSSRNSSGAMSRTARAFLISRSARASRRRRASTQASSSAPSDACRGRHVSLYASSARSLPGSFSRSKAGSDPPRLRSARLSSRAQTARFCFSLSRTRRITPRKAPYTDAKDAHSVLSSQISAGSTPEGDR